MAEPAAAPSLLDRFSALEDPRQRAKVLYPLPEILLLLLCATLARADDLVEITLWGEEQLSFLRRFLPYRRGMVESATERDGRIAREQRYYLGSARLDAVSFAQAVRAPWGIENRLHWVLDVVFHDDLSGLRTGHAPQTMAVVRHMAMNLLRQAKPSISLKNRRKRAAWNTAYLEQLVQQSA
jgi:predicted transposase YbfD/YdcC